MLGDRFPGSVIVSVHSTRLQANMMGAVETTSTQKKTTSAGYNKDKSPLRIEWGTPTTQAGTSTIQLGTLSIGSAVNNSPRGGFANERSSGTASNRETQVELRLPFQLPAHVSARQYPL